MIPLRTIHLAGYPLRIYASPHSEPDYPWAAFDDLVALAEWDGEEQEKRWMRMAREFPEMIHKTPEGVRLIANLLVEGLFWAWLEMGCEPAQALLDYWHEAWSEAFAAQYAHLPRAEWLRAVQVAELRNAPAVPGVTVIQ